MAKFGVGILEKGSLRNFESQLRLVERVGYDQVWIPDERFYRDVFVSITVSALKTRRVKLGIAVTDPFIRHPVLTAIAVACVDEIASGRVVLGMGAGMSGFKELGIKRKSPAVAIKEAVEIMRGVLTGKPLFYEGAVFKVSGARLSFKARGDIPIYVAGRGPRVLETAGKVGDGAILGGFASEESVNYAFDQIRRGADAAGRNWEDLDYVSWVYCSLSEDGKEAKRVVKPIVAYLMEASEPVLERLGIQREIADPVIKGLKELRKEGAFSLYSREMMELASNLVSDKLVDKYSIAGTPEECARKVRRLLRLGIKQIAILPFPLPGGKNEDVMRLFAEEVIPQFK